MKAATEAQACVLPNMTFQSTPPVKAATVVKPEIIVLRVISIHAAREGGDLRLYYRRYVLDISIHAAREGGDGDEAMRQ